MITHWSIIIWARENNRLRIIKQIDKSNKLSFYPSFVVQIYIVITVVWYKEYCPVKERQILVQ